jgi:adenosylmethionine-8-amino-7-oxononanoate aminotransferase
MPLAVTLCRSEIYDAHVSTDRARTFFHSSSYTANPIACAAAAANLEIWNTEPVLDRIATLAATQSEQMERFEDDKRFINARRIGTIAAIDIAHQAGGYLADVALTLRQSLLRRNVLLRPLGATMYVMPPYCTEPDDLEAVYTAIQQSVDEVLS